MTPELNLKLSRLESLRLASAFSTALVALALRDIPEAIPPTRREQIRTSIEADAEKYVHKMREEHSVTWTDKLENWAKTAAKSALGISYAS